MTVTLEVMEKARPFAALPAAAREALARSAREITFKPGERLIPLGQPPQRLLVIVDGLVKLVGVSANGHERILYVHRPGDLVGPTVLLDQFEQDYEAAAMSEGRALSISRRDLLIVGRNHSSIIMALAKEVSRLLASMTERMMAATSSEVPVRLSQLLLEFARRDARDRVDGRATDMVPLSYPLTHEAMAQIVGASRPHTSTVLRDLEGLGAVRRKSADGLLVRPSRLKEIVDLGEIDLSLLHEEPIVDNRPTAPRPEVVAALDR